MRPAGLLTAVLVLLTAAAPAAAQSGKPEGAAQFAVTATPVPSFSRSEPERVRFGAMEFLGGLVLEAPYEDFGGFSGLRFLEDGEMLAISDRARWLRARLMLDGRRPAGLEQAAMAPMRDGNGAPLHATSSFDTEALALGDDGEAFVGVERIHRILRFDFGKRGFAATARGIDVPPAMRDLPRNAGIEGLVFMPRDRPLGGSLIAFSERGLDKAGSLRAFIVGGATPGEFAVRRSGDFDITDAALIPGGDILILERFFSWFRGLGMRIRRIPLAEIQPGAVIEGTVLLEAGNAFQIDNMEAISADRTPDGETVVTILSDDNFTRLQRTLLLRFALIED